MSVERKQNYNRHLASTTAAAAVVVVVPFAWWWEQPNGRIASK